MWQIRGVDRGERREVRSLLLSGPQPQQLGTLNDSVDDHQMLDGMAECQRSTHTALWLADGSIERLLMQVIDASAIVPAVVHRREAESGELGEKLPRLLPMDDPAEGGVLARDADAGVQHDGHEEPRLALREAAHVGNRLSTFREGHRNISSASPAPLLPPPRPPPPVP